MNSKDLGIVTEQLLASSFGRFSWDKTWQQPIDQGTSFEWAAVAAIVAQAENLGWVVSYPLLSVSNGSTLFTLRNQIPMHHGAQAGHQASRQNRSSLSDRFLQSVVPKVVLERNGTSVSIFREGCPYHAVMTGKDYDDRPDILFLSGAPTEGFPRLREDGRSVLFSFDMAGCPTISGELTIRNSESIPCRWRHPEGGASVPVAGIIECSVNKSHQVASEQLARYANIFVSGGKTPPLFLVTGNILPALQWPSAVVPLEGNDLAQLKADLLSFASSALTAFGFA